MQLPQQQAVGVELLLLLVFFWALQVEASGQPLFSSTAPLSHHRGLDGKVWISDLILLHLLFVEQYF